MRSLSVRARLMLLYLLVTLTGLLIFGLMSFGALQYALLQGKKTHLEGREERLISFLKENRQKGVHESLTEQLQNYALVTHEGNLFQIRHLDGSMFFPLHSGSADWAHPSPTPCIEPTYHSQGFSVLVLCHQILLDGQPVQLYIGGALEEEAYILHKYRNALLLLLPALLLLSSISGYFLSHFALRPVDRMTRAALEIGIGNLSRRLPVPAARDEIQHLAVAWNQLLARLEAAVSRLSQLSADASHDLRTSITIMLATAQLSLNRHRTEQHYRSALDKIVAECRTASTLLDALLSLAQSDNFVHELAFRQIDLCQLVIEGCRRVEDLAESSEIDLDWRLPPETTFIQGDEALLQRLLGILLDNAIRYTPKFGEIRTELAIEKDDAIITVRDTGVGMSEEVRRHIFDRFYQADLRERKSRAGNGLGLSIGRWIAEAHGAQLTVESTPSEGSVFTIRLPRQSQQIMA